MLSNLLTVAVLLSFLGCESKEYKKADNKNVQIVQELNQGDPEFVINALSNKELPPREKSYLASAYAQRGGVDVFSLYSVLELQLFRKSALEWSELSNEKNPYLKFMKGKSSGNLEEKLKKKEERWDKYLPKIAEKRGIKTKKPLVKDMDVDGFEYTEEQYQKDEEVLQNQFDEVMKLTPDSDIRMSHWYNIIQENRSKDSAFDPSYKLTNYYTDQILLETLKQQYLHPEEKTSGTFANVKWEFIYMNILWNAYETIPLMKQLPHLSDQQQEDISLSLDQYKSLLKDKEFGKVAIKNIVVLAGVSLLSVYKQSFDFDEIESVQDVLCGFEPGPIIDNYPLVRKRVLFLSEAAMESDLEEVKAQQKRIQEFKESLPEEITEEEKNNFRSKVDEYKLTYCFNG